MDSKKRGARLKTSRQSQGLSQKALAGKAGLSITYLSELESGKKEGRMRAWNQLADALGIDVTSLYSGVLPGQAPERVPVVGEAGGDPDHSFKWDISQPTGDGRGLEITTVRAMRVSGSGLAPLINDGHHVLFTEEPPSDGDLCVCSIGGRVCFKRIYRGRKTLTLLSVAGGRPISIRPSELDWAHRMVGVMFDGLDG